MNRAASRSILHRWGPYVLSALAGIMLIASSIPKIRYPMEFARAIYAYDLLGGALGYLAALILPWLELSIGLCLLANFMTRGARLLATVIFTVFALAQVSAIARGLTIACGCFDTSGERTVSWLTISVPLGLLSIILVAMWLAQETEDTEVESV